jgi:hypothetical protein
MHISFIHLGSMCLSGFTMNWRKPRFERELLNWEFLREWVVRIASDSAKEAGFPVTNHGFDTLPLWDQQHHTV